MGRVMARKTDHAYPCRMAYLARLPSPRADRHGSGDRAVPDAAPRLRKGATVWWDRCENPQGRHITKPRNQRCCQSFPHRSLSAALSLARAMTGCVVMFRQRRARPAVLFGQ